MITYDQFLESIDNDFEPSDDISLCLKALWGLKGDWEKAHDLAQQEGTVDGDWCMLISIDMKEILETLLTGIIERVNQLRKVKI